MTLWLVLMVGCERPLADRHHLEDLRIAAVSASFQGDQVLPRAAVAVDGRLWSDRSVDRRWFVLESEDVDFSDAEPTATGPSPTIALELGQSLGLEVVVDDIARRAVFSPAGTPDVIAGIDGELIVDPGDETSLEVQFMTPPSDDVRVRWMAAQPFGRFVEQSPTEASWFAETDAALPLSNGPVTVLVLGLNGAGANDFMSANLWVGEPDQGAWLDDAWVPSNVSLEPGPWTVTLMADDQSPWGLTIDAVGSSPLVPDCAQGAFHPDWLVAGLCTRSQLDGATVQVVVQ